MRTPSTPTLSRTGLTAASRIGGHRVIPVLPACGVMKRALNSLTESAAVTWDPEGDPHELHHPGSTAMAMTVTGMAAWLLSAIG